MTIAPLLGMMAYFGGEPATRALIASTPAHDITIAPWVKVVGALVTANIAINRAVDALPFREQRLRWRGRNGDRFWRINMVTSRVSARKNGITSTPYDHHDGTPATPAGCPIH
ncbi:hypothetical protein NCCP2495_19070 [Dietzia sp. NCCP-2495]|uniref:hypothetical protein n=1 Tax=Dietzia sp. NCCP-2495 TaxID=2934675 RepID=UPI002230F6F5|nr:hypothetical protein [Dietzia sp. NCCP-2495]GLB64028.1 hypothetical protein NCCP2495_19070 [Dietzia sp. NCCP-2495]